MKKNYFAFIMLLASLTAAAQEKYGAGAMTYNDDGNVVFSEVIQQEGSAHDLYSRMKVAIADAFDSAKDVIQVDDPETGIIVAKGLNKLENVVIDFTLKVQARDGRFRIQLYDITYTAHLSTLPDTVWPAELLTDSECLNKKGECKKIGKGHARRCVIDTKEWLFETLTTKIAAGAPSNDDNW